MLLLHLNTCYLIVIFHIVVDPFSLLFLYSFLPLTLFLYVRVLSLLCCSVTRSRSSLSLVYVLPVFCFFVFSFACRLSGLVLAHPVCVGSRAPQRAFALLPYCRSFSADRSTGCGRCICTSGFKWCHSPSCMSETQWFVCLQNYCDTNWLTS